MEHFWSKVDRSSGPDACWPWLGYRWASGYGSSGGGGRPKRRAHRLAWELANGPIPAGLSVLHRCDNPPCCNPAHLFLGTHAGNMADKRAKGRTARGEGHGKAVLTEAEVRDIRRLADAGHTQAALARKFGVTYQQVHKIVHRLQWVGV